MAGKHTFLLSVCLLAFWLAFPSHAYCQASPGDSWQFAKQQKKAKLTVLYLEEDLFAYTDANGLPAGLEIDIFNHFQVWLKHTKGVELEVTFRSEKSFLAFYQTVKQARDGIMGLGTVTILESRKKEVNFSPPFISNIVVLVSHNSVPTLTGLAQFSNHFNGFTGVAASGTTLETITETVRDTHMPQLTIKRVANQMDAVDLIASNTNFLGFMDLANYWPAVDRQKLPLKRHPVADIPSESFGFITPLMSEWNAPLTEFFLSGAGYRANPAYRALLVKHLGAEVTKMLSMAQQKPAKK